ncbi:MAG: hypothetical protein NZM35_07905 [Chitinophagales bacterium]|nr:hypothetical protein [Chitinophagales bacterium]MDW8419150.1 hypothetical protein [Chitinophagales bacterium]
MKKVFLVLAVSAALIGTQSCKKKAACACTAGGVTTEGATVEYKNKKDYDAAKEACEKGSNSALGITCKFVDK